MLYIIYIVYVIYIICINWKILTVLGSIEIPISQSGKTLLNMWGNE